MSKICNVSNDVVQLYIDRVSTCHIAEWAGEKLLYNAGVIYDGIIMEMQRMDILSVLFLGLI